MGLKVEAQWMITLCTNRNITAALYVAGLKEKKENHLATLILWPFQETYIYSLFMVYPLLTVNDVFWVKLVNLTGRVSLGYDIKRYVIKWTQPGVRCLHKSIQESISDSAWDRAAEHLNHYLHISWPWIPYVLKKCITSNVWEIYGLPAGGHSIRDDSITDMCSRGSQD